MIARIASIFFGVIFAAAMLAAIGCIVAAMIRFHYATSWFDPLGNALAFRWADTSLLVGGVSMIAAFISMRFED